VAHAILVVDDDPDILSIVSMSLEAQGYTVHKATNGREAVDLAREHHPDLMLLDMMMPELSGYEAVAELKGDPATREIPIVGLSAKAMATDMERPSPWTTATPQAVPHRPGDGGGRGAPQG
jgi:CheY-like chemotaxis protein